MDQEFGFEKVIAPVNKLELEDMSDIIDVYDVFDMRFQKNDFHPENAFEEYTETKGVPGGQKSILDCINSAQESSAISSDILSSDVEIQQPMSAYTKEASLKRKRDTMLNHASNEASLRQTNQLGSDSTTPVAEPRRGTQIVRRLQTVAE